MTSPVKDLSVATYLLCSLCLTVANFCRVSADKLAVFVRWVIDAPREPEPKDPFDELVESLEIRLALVSPGGIDYNADDLVNQGYRNALFNVVYEAHDLRRRRDHGRPQ